MQASVQGVVQEETYLLKSDCLVVLEEVGTGRGWCTAHIPHVLGENVSLVTSGVAKRMRGSNTRYPNFLLAAEDFISDKSIVAL